ncbi:MAG TPA: adenylate/guanylate cyclase domain-containing protein [Actinomycetota bacterium]|nr:adenylate/guanylate cyclase domain-containing protein [Actinomycetota bacterium]
MSQEQHDGSAGRPDPRASAGAPAVRDPERLPPLIRPAADFIARIRATVHTKFLAGFLVIAVLLLGMGVTSILVIREMNEQANQLIDLQRQSDLARQAIYSVTAQSHYRAMALTTHLDSWNDKIETAKESFGSYLDGMDAIGGPGVQAAVQRMRQIDVRYAAAGAEVLALYDAGDLDAALALHISAEHEISHELEDELNAQIASTEERIDVASGELSSLHRFLLFAVGIFSGVSLLIALGLGAALSWSVIRPVRKVDLALARIADGDFGQQVDVPNRDEFGRLTTNLNWTSEQLAKLYRDLAELNQNLEKTVEDQLGRIRRAEELRRYLAPQVADAVLSGGAPVSLTSTRRNLSILVATIRGFSSMSEGMEPEEVIDGLNQHFAVMTDVVFRHGGTLDKYIGDGVLAFFGDPIPFEDHAERAVMTALEMRQRLRGLRARWSADQDGGLDVGIGISTGYVTVGNIGSATRTEYTVIGNHVNLATHLAHIAGADQILVSERTLSASSSRERVEATSLDAIQVDGFRHPVRVFEITDLPAPLRRRL